MIELNEEYELAWLEFCLNQPWKITALPIALYHKFFDYLTQEGRWQDVFKITQVKDKIVYQTVDELLDGAECIFNSEWTLDEVLDQYSSLLDKERELDDVEFANRALLLKECTSIRFGISSLKLDLIVRRRVLDYCERNNIPIDQYDGPLPYNLYKQLF
jgi:hypothetical protein